MWCLNNEGVPPEPFGVLQMARPHVDVIRLPLIGAEVIPLLFLSFMLATLVTGE